MFFLIEPNGYSANVISHGFEIDFDREDVRIFVDGTGDEI